MAQWKNIDINENLIEAEAINSILINCPHNSGYDGFSFWHSQKLVRSGHNRTTISIGYTDNFTFHLKKYGKGRYNKFDVIDEVDVDAFEFEQIFENASSEAAARKNPYETHKPATVEAEKAEVLDELKDE